MDGSKHSELPVFEMAAKKQRSENRLEGKETRNGEVQEKAFKESEIVVNQNQEQMKKFQTSSLRMVNESRSRPKTAGDFKESRRRLFRTGK